MLTPGRYVGTEDQEDDGILFADRIAQLREKLAEQFEESTKMQQRIAQILLGNFA